MIFQIFDRLCQNFGGDVFETLFYSADTLVNCSEENRSSCIWKLIYDLALATASSNILFVVVIFFLFVACIFYFPNLSPWHFLLFHSFILLAQAITLSTCIVAHNNALLALLVSNNFSEIKGNVFKRFSKENIQILVYAGEFTSLHSFLYSDTVLCPFVPLYIINACLL